MSDVEKRVSKIVIVVLAITGIAGATMAFRQMLGEARKVAAVRTLPTYGQVPAFTLTRETGGAMSLSDLTGRVWIADFIFTRCAGPCPIMTKRMADLQGALGDLEGLRLVSFSVDPEYDTPEILTKYARDCGAHPDRWAFLTGGRTEIYDLSIQGFKLAVDTGENYDQRILHSTKFVLVDGQARVRGYYEGTDADELKKLKADARALAHAAELR